MNEAFLSLGSNLGDRRLNIKLAEESLIKHGCVIHNSSSIYETEAWGKKDQPAFYNEVIKIQTSMTAQSLMQAILEIEKALGRKRIHKWEPRIIDIDILFFNDAIIHDQNLTIPHPHLHERNFVLLPLAEIAASWIHPVLKKTVKDLLVEIKDDSLVERVA